MMGTWSLYVMMSLEAIAISQNTILFKNAVPQLDKNHKFLILFIKRLNIFLEPQLQGANLD